MAQNINGTDVETTSEGYTELAENAIVIAKPPASTNVEYVITGSDPLQFGFELEGVIVAQDEDTIILMLWMALTSVI